MMWTIDIFEKVASREMTPEAGAQLAMERKTAAAVVRRPDWMPKVMFAICSFAIVLVLSLFGVKAQQQS